MRHNESKYNMIGSSVKTIKVIAEQSGHRYTGVNITCWINYHKVCLMIILYLIKNVFLEFSANMQYLAAEATQSFLATIVYVRTFRVTQAGNYLACKYDTSCHTITCEIYCVS